MSGALAGPVGVGIIGAGVISAQYLETLRSFPDVAVHAVADLDLDRARARADEFGVADATTVEGLLADPRIELVVNLTIPAAHVAVALQALDSGKHVWSEKPFALDPDEGRRLLAHAAQLGLRAASAPDTFLGPSGQALRRVVDEGGIGTPILATAAFESGGPESWHPAPDFLYDVGAGPLFDMGPYYVTALVHVLGGVASVAAVGARPTATRRIGSGPRAGEEFPVRVPTSVAAVLRFASGAVAQASFGFDAVRPRVGVLEITGTGGHVVAADPNQFDQAVTLQRRGSDAPEPVEVAPAAYRRGIGVLELARAIRAGHPERASGELAAHVLDVLDGIARSVDGAGEVAIDSRPPRIEALEPGWDPTEATLRSA